MRRFSSLVVLWVAGCAAPGVFTWVDRVSPAELAPAYGMNVGDLLRVRVLPQEALGGDVRVRADGRITLPFAEDVRAAGRTPQDLAVELQTTLRPVLVDPRVSVLVVEAAPLDVAVLGHVNRPGMYRLEGGRGVLHALAQAGGTTEDADGESIYVLRNHGAGTRRIRFSMDALSRGVGAAGRFQLLPADVVMVE